MQMYLYALVLSMANLLVPSSDPVLRHGRLATSIARTVSERGPLFRADKDYRKTISVLVAVAFRESSLDPGAIGDHGQSFCAFQIHRSSGGHIGLTESPDQCVDKAYEMLAQSVRIDQRDPIAFYARGPKYMSEEARKISRDRMLVAKKLLRIDN